MGSSASNLSYSPVNNNLPLATIDACKLPPSVDLRSRKLTNVTRRTRVHSCMYAVMSCLVIECERNGISFVLPSMGSISEAVLPDGCVNPAIVVDTINMGANPESDSDGEFDHAAERIDCRIPFLSLQRVECDVEIIRRCLAQGRPVICAISVSDDTLEEGEWRPHNKNAATICCCITGYTTYSAEFLMYEPTFAKKRLLQVPFDDVRSHVAELFLLDMSSTAMNDPLFIG